MSETSKINLERTFSREKIIHAVNYMHHSKVPGPDGTHAIFYQQIWDVVGEDLISLCLEILNNDVHLDSN